MSEVHTVTVHITLPRGSSPGQVCHGCYTVADNVVTLTDRDGHPVRDAHGKIYSRTMEPGGIDAHDLAGVLTQEFRLALLGKTKASERFSRPLTYPKAGFA
jgi:hypothetical protein